MDGLLPSSAEEIQKKSANILTTKLHSSSENEANAKKATPDNRILNFLPKKNSIIYLLVITKYGITELAIKYFIIVFENFI